MTNRGCHTAYKGTQTGTNQTNRNEEMGAAKHGLANRSKKTGAGKAIKTGANRGRQIEAGKQGFATKNKLLGIDKRAGQQGQVNWGWKIRTGNQGIGK